LGFSASVGFIHKESVTMHGHKIVKFLNVFGNNVLHNGCNKYAPRSLFCLSLTLTQRWHSEYTDLYLCNHRKFVA